jgi:carotenoid cleavage dioxygenase-like enzyme
MSITEHRRGLRFPDQRVYRGSARRALFGAYRNPHTDDPSVAGVNRGEMPVIDTRYANRRHRHAWFGAFNPALGPMLERGPKGPPFTCIGHFDYSTGTLSYYYAGADSAPEEPTFVPAYPGAPEGVGIRIPFRIHEGFHGTWVQVAP